MKPENEKNFANLSFTPQQLALVISTPEGRRLLQLLQQDGGQALRQAGAAMAAGNTEDAKRVLAPMLQNPEAAALLQKLQEEYTHGRL